jgi:O-antigen ligase
MLTIGGARITWPRFLAASALFFLPYMFLRPASLLFTLSDALFLLAGVALVLGRGAPVSPFGALTPYWYAGVGLMLGALLISSVAHSSEGRWLSVAGQYAFSLLALPAILLISDRARWLLLVRAFVAGIVVMEILTFGILYYYDWDYETLHGKFGPEFLTGMGRVTGFLGGANLHSAVLCMALPFVFYLRGSGLMSRLVFALSVGLICAGVFYSASFTGFVTLVLVAGLFLVVGRVRISPQFAAGVAAIAFAYIAAGAPVPGAFEKRVGGAIQDMDIEEAGTFTHRLDLMKEAWAMADESMLVGIGVDRYRTLNQLQTPVHNSYMLVWVEGGFPALIGWVTLLLVLGFGALLIRRERPLDAAVGLCVLAVFIIFSFTSAYMYARVWVAPVILALGPAFARAHQLQPMRNTKGWVGSDD